MNATDIQIEAAALVLYGRGWGRASDVEMVQARKVADAVVQATRHTVEYADLLARTVARPPTGEG